MLYMALTAGWHLKSRVASQRLLTAVIKCADFRQNSPALEVQLAVMQWEVGRPSYSCQGLGTATVERWALYRQGRWATGSSLQSKICKASRP